MTQGKQKEQASSPVRKKKMDENKLQQSGLGHKRKSGEKKGSRTREYSWGNKNRASLEKESLCSSDICHGLMFESKGN